ncbi:MAG TPA: TonB-dependent receptor [Novosphingobium sp.]|nr:TonB-dependent receptor [Novosphingobium sp.]
MSNFDIPAQVLSKALTLYGRQAGVQIFFPSGHIDGITSVALKGNMPRQAALRRLIAGSGLEIKTDDGKTVVLGMADGLSDAVAEQRVGVTDIVVTAQHRKQTEQDVPIALTVIDGKDLDKRNVQNVNDLENSVPSLEIDKQFGGGQPQFRLRGVGGTDYAANNTNTVGVYVDDVALPYGSMTQGAMFDIERIEVLRGPQGTLYGRNTTGGAISIITGEPTRDFHAGVDVSYGSYNALDVQGHVSGALSDTLTGRLAVTTSQGGAWQYNRDTGEKLGNRNQTAVRGKLRWQPSSKTTVDFAGEYNRDKSDGLGLHLLTSFTDGHGVYHPADTDPRATGWGVSSQLASIMGVGTNAKPFRNNTGYGAQVKLTTDLGWGTLTAIPAHRHFTRKEFNDWDGTSSNEANTYFFNDIDVDSGEIRLASRQNGHTRWQLGLYHSAEHVTGGFYSDFTDYTSLANLWKTSYSQRVNTSAIYGSGEHDLTSKLTVSAGLRFEHEVRRMENFTSEVIYPTYALRAAANQHLEMNEWSGRAALDWRFSRQAHAYASVSRGVKSGGFTTYNTGIPDQLNPYNPEKLVAYELGIKSDLFDRKLRVNVSGFYYDYYDYQLQGVIYTGSSRVGRILNVPRANLWGGELEITAAPIEGLQITQSLAYKIGHYDVYMAPVSATKDSSGNYTNITYANYAGQRLPLPLLDYKGEFSYDAQMGNGWVLTPEINYNHRSKRWSTTDLSMIPGYWLANANLTLSPPDKRFQIGLWVHNMFDAYVQETRNQFTSARTVSVNPTRTFGVRLNYTY